MTGGKATHLVYTHRMTALGMLMLAASVKGVCFAQFGEDESALYARLRAEFPDAALSASPALDVPELDAWATALDHYISAGARRPELPLDMPGTAFQAAVWQCLLGTREGEVVSYREVAERIGRPNAVRAVASACGRNRIAILVPCHRVVRSDGGLGGYRWGIERKRALLNAERHR